MLDYRRLSRRTRALLGWLVLLSLVLVVHAWAYVYQRGYTRLDAESDNDKMDITDARYPAHLALYVCCALMDAMWQTTAYWMIGAMSNDPRKLAHMTGFCASSRICACPSDAPPQTSRSRARAAPSRGASTR